MILSFWVKISLKAAWQISNLFQKTQSLFPELNYDFSESNDLLEVYPHGYHKIDKKGRPIYIECQGKLRIDEVFKITSEERLVKHYIQSYEMLLKLRFPACSAVAGHRIEQDCFTSINSVFLIDQIIKSSMKILTKKVYALIQLASKIGSDYYPEIIIYKLDTPMLFTGVWAVVKGFIDEKTRKKITIAGSKYQKDLLELVEDYNLPDFLGGKCTCAFKKILKFTGCMKNLLMNLQRIGIRRKQGNDQEETKSNQH